MRELKFRVYIPDHEKFCYFTLGNFDYSDRYLHQHSYPVQQYTGLKDKNKVEIYEGDVVTYQQPYRASCLTHPATTDSYRTIVAPVIYNEDSFQFEIDSYPIGTPMIKTRKDLKIIGNIFENPELLK